MRRAQNADTHALKQPRLSQNSFPVCSSFALVIAFDMHLESESEKRWFTHSKKYPDTIHTFSLFLDEFLWNDLRPIYCSLTCWRPAGTCFRHGGNMATAKAWDSWFHRRWISWRSWTALMDGFNCCPIRCFRKSQVCSTGLRSGLCGGQCIVWVLL